MTFIANKRAWSEVYTLLHTLHLGTVQVGQATTPSKKSKKEKQDTQPVETLPVVEIMRIEHDGPRIYTIDGDEVRVEGEDSNKTYPTVSREVCGEMAQLIISAMRDSKEYEVESPEAVEAFLDDIQLFDLEAQTEDRTDMHIRLYHPSAPSRGVVVRSRLTQMNPLLDGGRTANLKFQQQGIKFASPTVSKVNALESAYTVADRMLLIERLGGILKYHDVHDKVFRSNLHMIDLHFPRVLAEMLRIMHLDGIVKINELVDIIKEINPLKVKDELIHKHYYYEHKMKQFLLTLFLGMRPAKVYTGQDSAVHGMLLVQGDGSIAYLSMDDREVLRDFLYHNSRFEMGDLHKDHYGELERENGVYYFRLNAKIGLTKR